MKCHLLATLIRGLEVLTFCFVTRGRHPEFQLAMSKLVSIVQTLEGTQLIIFLNGLPQETAETIEQSMKDVPRVKVITRISNNPSVNWIIDELQKNSARWTVFPADDDEISLATALQLRNEVANNPTEVAVAYPCETIDATGKRTREIIFPPSIHHLSDTEVVAHALHEPLFVWPITLIDVSHIKSDLLPDSRFVSDWIVAIALSTTGKIKISRKTIGYLYRRHALQESSIETNLRKFTEAESVISRFVSQEFFKNWLDKLSEKQVDAFWDYILLNRPVYGSSFSRSITLIILNLILTSKASMDLKYRCMLKFGLAHGFFSLPTDMPSFCNSLRFFERDLEVFIRDSLNRSLFRESSCPLLALSSLRIPESCESLITILCINHDSQEVNSENRNLSKSRCIFLECHGNLLTSSATDSILVSLINTALSQEFQHIDTLSPIESKMIRRLRGIRQKKLFRAIIRQIKPILSH